VKLSGEVIPLICAISVNEKWDVGLSAHAHGSKADGGCMGNFNSFAGNEKRLRMRVLVRSNFRRN